MAYAKPSSEITAESSGELRANDVICMAFDVADQSLTFTKTESGGDEMSAVIGTFRNIPIESKRYFGGSYCLAVYLGKRDSVTLQDFWIEETKKVECTES